MLNDMTFNSDEMLNEFKLNDSSDSENCKGSRSPGPWQADIIRQAKNINIDKAMLILPFRIFFIGHIGFYRNYSFTFFLGKNSAEIAQWSDGH
ncbi:hypothetical protein GCM10028791_40460 [Echinicola sediminis]